MLQAFSSTSAASSFSFFCRQLCYRDSNYTKARFGYGTRTSGSSTLLDGQCHERIFVASVYFWSSDKTEINTDHRPQYRGHRKGEDHLAWHNKHMKLNTRWNETRKESQLRFDEFSKLTVQGRPGPSRTVRVLLSSLERSQWRDGMCDISNLARLGVLGHRADDEREPHLAKEMRELGTECRRLLRGWTASLSGHVWQSKFGLARRSRFSSHELRPRRV